MLKPGSGVGKGLGIVKSQREFEGLISGTVRVYLGLE
jgi:hypothetical protein